VDLSDNGTVDVSAMGVNSFISCELNELMRLDESLLSELAGGSPSAQMA
jgi:hypothetical protein